MTAGEASTRPAPLILLMGMMGAGKSTVGCVLAAQLGWKYVDGDDEILRRTGRSVPDLWRAEGEAAFRAEETRVLVDVATVPEPTVVALGGGAVLAPANREVITASGGMVVWLRVDVGTVLSRVGDGAGRPLLEGDAARRLSHLDAERRPVYESLAELIIDVDCLRPDEIADLIVKGLAARPQTPAAPQTFAEPQTFATRPQTKEGVS
jgi:shikimate kinase